MFVIIFFGILEFSSGKLFYINGGYELVFIVDSNYQLKIKLIFIGLVVGMLFDLQFKMVEIILQLGDLLLFYIDGVMEVKLFIGNFFGKEKLLNVLGSLFNLVD